MLCKTLDISKDAKMYTQSTTVEFDGLPIYSYHGFVMTMTESISIEIVPMLSIAMGHLEVKGFEMHNWPFQ